MSFDYFVAENMNGILINGRVFDQIRDIYKHSKSNMELSESEAEKESNVSDSVEK